MIYLAKRGSLSCVRTAKVILQGYIIVPDKDLNVVKSALSEHIKLTRQEEGCLAFRVSQDSENQHIFEVYEEVVDRDAFEIHQQRVKKIHHGVEFK